MSERISSSSKVRDGVRRRILVEAVRLNPDNPDSRRNYSSLVEFARKRCKIVIDANVLNQLFRDAALLNGVRRRKIIDIIGSVKKEFGLNGGPIPREALEEIRSLSLRRAGAWFPDDAAFVNLAKIVRHFRGDRKPCQRMRPHQLLVAGR